MAVKIRLTRMGKKKQPTYRVVVMDSRKPRDGKYIEQIGRYDPRQDPSVIEIDNDRALVWLRQGAQPSDRARKLLEISGAWTQFKVDRGEIHTVSDTAAPSPPGEIHVVGDSTGIEDEPAAPAVSDSQPDTEVGVDETVAAAEADTAEIATPVAPVDAAADETETDAAEDEDA